LDLAYYGPLTDGSAREAELAEIIEVQDYKLVSHDGTKLGLVVEVTCLVHATVELPRRGSEIMTTISFPRV
jgi:hypothetical protein